MRGCIISSLAGLVLIMGTMSAEEKLGVVEFQKRRVTITKLLASPNLNDRIAGLNELKKYPVMDSVKLAMPFWSKDPNPHVRWAAADVLYAFKDVASLRPSFRDGFKKELNDGNSVLAGVWLASAKPEEQREALESLAKMIEKRPPALFSLFPVADWLGTHEDAMAVTVLDGFTRLPAFKTHFGFRRCLVTALVGVRHPDAVTKLLDLMPEVDGEVRGDIFQHLTKISGQRLADDPEPWQAWWKVNRANFQFPDANGRLAIDALKPGQPAYYGIPIYARKVMFIIDTSGSMKGERIVNARKELIKTIESLPTGTSFNLVSFNSELAAWNRNTLVPISTESRTRSVRWVNQLEAEGSTYTFDALRVTLDQKPEAIYLLTDGQPTGGSVVAPDAILEAIRQRNRYHRTTIHVIGINPGPEDGVFSQFMKNLAAQNWGQYRRVD